MGLVESKLQLPRGAAREYLQTFGVAAVYVATSDDGQQSMVASSLDLDKSETVLRLKGYRISAVHWVKDSEAARLLVRKARAGGDIALAAGALGIKLTAHAVVMARVAQALCRIERELAKAQAQGELGWFNRAYKGYRQARAGVAGAAGGRVMLYGEARARLRKALLKRLVAGRTIGSDDLRAEVFGDQGEYPENTFQKTRVSALTA